MNKDAVQGVENTTTISVRINKSIKQRLDAIARSAQRSKSFLAGEAIEEYLAVQEWQIARIKDAMKLVTRHGAVPHEDVVKWVASWSKKRATPMPKPRKV